MRPHSLDHSIVIILTDLGGIIKEIIVKRAKTTEINGNGEKD